MFLLLANLSVTLDQPTFLGKVLVWVLFMLSIVSWVILLSKAIQLLKSRRESRSFVERLRKSQSVLALYESDSDVDSSLSGAIYRAGAAEAAYHLLNATGASETEEPNPHRTKSLGAMQIECVNLAFRSGFQEAIRRLDPGIAILGLIAATASFVGGFGFLWTLMGGFENAVDYSALSPVISAAIGFLLIGVLVSAPAFLGRLILQNSIRGQTRDLERFCVDLQRLFERKFAAHVVLDSGTPIMSPHDHATAPDDSGTQEDENEAGREYHSIRQRFQKNSEESDSGFAQMNPIARQTMGPAIRR